MKVSQIAILNEILKKIDLNNQTVSTCGQLEPIFSLKYADISCVIALYFLSFFYEHPVECADPAFYLLNGFCLKINSKYVFLEGICLQIKFVLYELYQCFLIY